MEARPGRENSDVASAIVGTYQVNAVNATPYIAGLMNALPRLLTLPAELTNEAQKRLWKKVLNDLPPIPMGMTAKGKLPPQGQGDPDGKRVILPARQYGRSKNSENPELYAVFPYRLYGACKPDFDLARNTYKARLFHFAKCWGQDETQSATLGLTDEAKKAAIQEFTSYGNQQFR